jgi:hypothetical protein
MKPSMTKKERQERARKAIHFRWSTASPEQRKETGKRLAQARKEAKERRQGILSLPPEVLEQIAGLIREFTAKS